MKEAPTEKQNKKDKFSTDEDILKQAKKDLILNQRLRTKNQQEHQNTEARKQSQDELQKKKVEELRRRFENGEILNTTKKTKVKKMDQI